MMITVYEYIQSIAGHAANSNEYDGRKGDPILNKRNYQKELDKLIENVRKEGRTPDFFFTPAVRRAAVM